MCLCDIIVNFLIQNLSRTYAQAVAGVATLMKYDAVSKNFTLQYHTTKACTSNTTEVCGLKDTYPFFFCRECDNSTV